MKTQTRSQIIKLVEKKGAVRPVEFVQFLVLTYLQKTYGKERIIFHVLNFPLFSWIGREVRTGDF